MDRRHRMSRDPRGTPCAARPPWSGNSAVYTPPVRSSRRGTVNATSSVPAGSVTWCASPGSGEGNSTLHASIAICTCTPSPQENISKCVQTTSNCSSGVDGQRSSACLDCSLHFRPAGRCQQSCSYHSHHSSFGAWVERQRMRPGWPYVIFGVARLAPSQSVLLPVGPPDSTPRTGYDVQRYFQPWRNRSSFA